MCEQLPRKSRNWFSCWIPRLYCIIILKWCGSNWYCKLFFKRALLESLVHKLSSKIVLIQFNLFPAVFLHASLVSNLINETILGFQLNPIAVEETFLFDHPGAILTVTLHHLSWDWSLFVVAASVTQWGLAWRSTCTTLCSQTRFPYCLGPRFPIDVSDV